MTPAQFTVGTRINPLHAGLKFVSAIIGPDLHGGSADAPPQPANLGWIALLSLTVVAALLLIVTGHGAGRRGDTVAPFLFFSGVLLLIVPISFRIAWPSAARGERLFLLLLLAEALFYYKAVYSPTSFVRHDEFLHWIAADDLVTARRLFLSNSLLPIGPAYPALEILTMAIVDLTGLSLFAAGTLMLVVLKGTFVSALFLFYERIAGSPRIAACACLVYMGCTTFVVFNSMFSYESLGIVLCVLVFSVEAASKDLVGRPKLKSLGLITLLLASLAVAHHLSAAFAAIYLAALAALEALRRHNSPRIETRIALSLTAILAIGLPLIWMQTHGSVLIGYLGPVIESGFDTLLGKIMGAVTRQSEAIGAPAQPLFLRLMTLSGILLLALGLATGFFRSLAMAAPKRAQTGWGSIRNILKLYWRDSRIVLLALLAFGFPISVVFRLTVAGWEIGNRMSTFVFVGVGLVVAVSIVHFWQGRTPRGWRRVAPVVALAIIVLGGVTSAALEPMRGPYRVAADQQSVEHMGIETALWTREWLGPGNRFTADRVNRLLLGRYGRQHVKTNIVEGLYAERVFETEKLGPDEFYALVRSDIDFLLVDLRLSTSAPTLGFYFEPWDTMKGTVLSPSALLKFNDVNGITRIYDNGWIVIYDVRGLHEHP